MPDPEIKAKIGGDSSPLKRELSSAKAAVVQFAENSKKAFNNAGEGAFGGMFKGLSARFLAVTGAVVGAGIAVKNFADEMGSIADAADKFGATTDEIQRIKFVAEQSGGSIEAVGKTLARLTLDAKDAAAGSEKQARAFARVGIEAKEFIGLNMAEKLQALAKAYDAAGGDVDKLVDLQDLLGTKGQSIWPLLAQGADGLAESLAGVATYADKIVRKTDEIADAWEARMRGMKVATATAIGFIYDHIAGAATKLGELSAGQMSLINDDGVVSFKDDKPKASQAEIEAKSEKELEKVAEERLKIADKIRDAARAEMDLKDKIADSEREILRLRQEFVKLSLAGDSKKALEVVRQIADESIELSGLRKQYGKDLAAEEDRIKKLEGDIAEKQRQNLRERMDLTSQIKEVESKIADLRGSLAGVTDKQKELEIRKKILDEQSKLYELQDKAQQDADEAARKQTDHVKRLASLERDRQRDEEQREIDALDSVDQVYALEKLISDEKAKQAALEGEQLEDAVSYSNQLQSQLETLKQQNKEKAKETGEQVANDIADQSLMSSQERSQAKRDQRKRERAKARADKLIGKDKTGMPDAQKTLDLIESLGLQKNYTPDQIKNLEDQAAQQAQAAQPKGDWTDSLKTKGLPFAGGALGEAGKTSDEQWNKTFGKQGSSDLGPGWVDASGNAQKEPPGSPTGPKQPSAPDPTQKLTDLETKLSEIYTVLNARLPSETV